MSHTPGPWEVHDGGKPDPTICKVTGTTPHGSGTCRILAVVESPTAKADAQLMAAAPDLLETAERLWNAMKPLEADPKNFVVVPVDVLNELGAAMTKARTGK